MEQKKENEVEGKAVTAEMIADTTASVVQGIMNLAQQKIETYLHENGFKDHSVILKLEVTEPQTQNEKEN